LPYLEQANVVSAANYDLTQDWWRTQSNMIEDPANPGTYIPSPTSVAVPNGITVQKFLEVFMCPSTAVPLRTQFKSDPAVGHKIGACGDYFTPEGVHSAILAELPTTLPLGAPLAPARPGVLVASHTTEAQISAKLGFLCGGDVGKSRAGPGDKPALLHSGCNLCSASPAPLAEVNRAWHLSHLHRRDLPALLAA
jgi:hypothetical protein